MFPAGIWTTETRQEPEEEQRKESDFKVLSSLAPSGCLPTEGSALPSVASSRPAPRARAVRGRGVGRAPQLQLPASPLEQTLLGLCGTAFFG